jgi:replicative DNA helicase
MGKVLSFPTEQTADYRIDFCDPEDRPIAAGRVPPHNLDAEAAVLSAVLLGALDPEKPHETLEAVQPLLAPETFYSEANGRAWQAIQQLRLAGSPVDYQTVGGWLHQRQWQVPEGSGSWSQYLERISECTPAVVNVAAHAELVREAWERRQIIATAQRVTAEGFGDVGGHEAWKRTLRADFGKVTAPRARLAGKKISAVVKETRAHVEQAIGDGEAGVHFPWDAVEAMLGLLATGRQTILAGQSEHGKTAAAMQIAEHVARSPVDELGFGEAVYIVSGEMPGKSLLLRTACSFAGVDVLRIECRRATWDEIDAVGSWLGKLATLPIIIDDQPAAPSVIAARVREHQWEFFRGTARDGVGEGAGNLFPKCRMRLVLGDHLQDLQVFSDKRDERERIADTAHGWLNHIAKGREVATLLLSQLKTPPPQMKAPKFPPWPAAEDLFGSAAIKQSADAALAVQRPELLMRGAVPAKWVGVAAMCRLKSRFGGSIKRTLLGFDKGVFKDELPATARGESHYDGDE